MIEATAWDDLLEAWAAPLAAARARVQAEEIVPPYALPLFEPRRYKVIYGGRGAGRSWSAARALLLKAAESPIRVGCFRELQKSIRDSVHRLLSDQIELLGLDGFEVLQAEIRHRNGSLFLFEGLKHNVTKIKSLEGLDIAWIEEAERVSETSWNVLIPTVRKSGSEIWVTFNPDLETDPTYRRFVLNPPPDAWVIRVSWEDNPHISPELLAEKDHLYAVDPDAAAHVWGGGTRQASEAQILRGKWMVEEFEPDPEEWDGPYLGADFGFAADPSTLVKAWIHESTLYIERESYAIGLDIDATPDRWSSYVPGAERYTVRADSARPESISYLQRHGIPGVTAVKKWKGSVEDGIAYLRQFERIVIHPRCKHAADEARHYSYKVDERSGDILPVVVDKHNHVMDALRYALAPMIQAGSRPSVWVA